MGITVQDIVYVRFQAPDLDLMQSFLEDFGLHVSARTQGTLYMRGAGSAPHIHITELGPVPAALGLGLRADSREALEALAAETGTPVEETGEPGGGLRVRLKDPAGMLVDVLYGQDVLPELPRRAPLTLNPAAPRLRFGNTQRPEPGPSQVVRLGHAVIHTPHFRETLDFYQRLFGFLPSDSYYAGKKDNVMCTFLHCSLGKTYTDHHTCGFRRSRPPIPI